MLLRGVRQSLLNSRRSAILGGGGFVAATYGTVLGWWDFSDTTKVLNATPSQALNSEAVATVNDKGPNAYNATQATALKRPILRTNIKNGLQVIESDGTDWLELATARPLTKNRNGLTCAAVYTLDIVSGGNKNICAFQDSAFNYRFTPGHFNTNGDWFTSGKCADGAAGWSIYSGAGTVPVAAAWNIAFWVIDYAGGLGKIYSNGAVKLSSTSLGVSGATSNTDSSENPVLLAANLYDAAVWDGYVGEIMIWDGTMSDANRVAAEVSLGAKWGITVV